MIQVTSLQWIYTKIRQDHNILTNRIHFLNIIDLKYNLETMTEELMTEAIIHFKHHNHDGVEEESESESSP